MKMPRSRPALQLRPAVAGCTTGVVEHDSRKSSGTCSSRAASTAFGDAVGPGLTGGKLVGGRVKDGSSEAGAVVAGSVVAGAVVAGAVDAGAVVAGAVVAGANVAVGLGDASV